MKNLELLNKRVREMKCHVCKSTGYKAIAPSIATEGVYYVVCTSCGHVSVASEMKQVGGEIAFSIAPTKQKKLTNKDTMVMIDAMNSFSAIGMPIMHTELTEENAVKYKESLIEEELELDIEDEIYEEVEEDNDGDDEAVIKELSRRAEDVAAGKNCRQITIDEIIEARDELLKEGNLTDAEMERLLHIDLTENKKEIKEQGVKADYMLIKGATVIATLTNIRIDAITHALKQIGVNESNISDFKLVKTEPVNLSVKTVSTIELTLG